MTEGRLYTEEEVVSVVSALEDRVASLRAELAHAVREIDGLRGALRAAVVEVERLQVVEAEALRAAVSEVESTPGVPVDDEPGGVAI